MKQKPSCANWTLIILLSAFIGSGPFSFHVITGVQFPLSEHFESSVRTFNLATSIPLAVLPLGSILMGALVHCVGVRTGIRIGLSLYVIGALLTLSGNFTAFVLGRILTYSSATVAAIASPILLARLFDSPNALRRQGYVDGGFVFFPMFAPLLGVFVSGAFGSVWVTTLPFFFAVALLVLLSRTDLPSASGKPSGRSRGTLVLDMLRLLGSAAFWAPVIWLTCAMIAYFAFVSAGSEVFRTALRVDATWFGVSFMALSVSFLAGTQVSSAAANTSNLLAMCLSAGVTCLGATGWLYILVQRGNLTPWWFLVCVACMTFSQGLAKPTMNLAVARSVPEVAGLAVGLSIFLQLSVAALSIQLLPYLSIDIEHSMAGMMLGASLIMMLVALILPAIHQSTSNS